MSTSNGDPADKLKDKLISQLISERQMYKSIADLHNSSIKQINSRMHALGFEKLYEFAYSEDDSDDDSTIEYLRAISNIMDIIDDIMKQEAVLLAAIIKHNTGVDPTKYPEKE